MRNEERLKCAGSFGAYIRGLYNVQYSGESMADDVLPFVVAYFRRACALLDEAGVPLPEDLASCRAHYEAEERRRSEEDEKSRKHEENKERAELERLKKKYEK